jgi:hypothetical protein
MGIYEAIKAVLDVARNTGNIDVVEKLLNVQKEALDLQEENRLLKEENAALKRRRESAGKEDKRGEGPYCSMCWELDQRLSKLAVKTDRSGNVHGYCAYCAEVRNAKR